MNGKGIVPQGTPSDAILNNEAALYDVMLSVALGSKLKDAVDESPISISTYYRLQREESEWFAAIKARAQADAIELTKSEQGRQVAKRIQKQIEADDLLLDNIISVLDQMIVEAKAGNDKAAKIVLEAAKKGAVFDRKTVPPEQAEMPSELPYNPHTTKLADLNLTVPPGTKVTVETPDPVLDLPEAQ